MSMMIVNPEVRDRAGSVRVQRVSSGDGSTRLGKCLGERRDGRDAGFGVEGGGGDMGVVMLGCGPVR